jgi:hypothetical protein
MSRSIRPILFVTSSSPVTRGALPDIELTNVVRDLRPKLVDASEPEASVVAEPVDEEGSDPKDPDSSVTGSALGSDSETSEKSTPGFGLALSPEPGPTGSPETSEASAPAERAKGLTAPVTLAGKIKPPAVG